MASTIAAITTGIGGIVTTADATGNLSLLSGTTTVVAVTSAGVAVTGTMTISTPLAVANGGTGVTTSTGSGANVLGTSPTLTTPLLGTPTSGVLDNCTGTNLAKAWVNFNGGSGNTAGVVNASLNVSSITVNGTGDYTINFTNALSDNKYCVTSCSGGTANAAPNGLQGVSYSNISTTVLRIGTVYVNGTLANFVQNTIAIFR